MGSISICFATSTSTTYRTSICLASPDWPWVILDLVDQIQIKVHLPNGEVVNAYVQDYIVACNMLVVASESSPDLRPACLDKQMQVECCTKDKRIQYRSSLHHLMNLMHSVDVSTPNALLEPSSSGSQIYVDNVPRPDDFTSKGTSSLVISSSSQTVSIEGSENKNQEPCAFPNHGANGERHCILNAQFMAASGGPLVDCDGNIVGINYYDAEQNPFLPSNLILECLGHDIYWAASKLDRRRADMIQNSSTPRSNGPNAERTDDELRLILSPWKPDGFKRRVNAILHALGYPLPSFVDDGMYLKLDFEEGFGGDIWNEPTRRVTSKMSRSIVALASFLYVKENDGSGKYIKDARKFACTGVFIESHESTTRILTSASLVRCPGDENIDAVWKIEVCLPSKRREEGILEYYNLQYNVAVVSIKSVHSYRAAKLDETSQTEVGAQVVALGRGFESGELMAKNGVVTGKRRKFGDEELQISTCKITKAGIGGPLVDFDGNFVGMNFYDTEQTPDLSRVRILELMREFNAERAVPVKTTDEFSRAVPVKTTDKFSSWPVPDPEWFYPTRYPAKRSPSRTDSE
ncbi:uncharacterized protein LOC124656667 [Lolium rigidum]|uniref:uncharacterized protein LOC124656667 n=1 Tax=Lolium rigidum TaxID=89674 RepID=UPI001F5DE91C|nr:uncharacterized protein LOC124656667 [Lolium rigidum]